VEETSIQVDSEQELKIIVNSLSYYLPKLRTTLSQKSTILSTEPTEIAQ
jgi:hypothetical protein